MSTTYYIDLSGAEPALEAIDVSVWYGAKRAVQTVSLQIPRNQVVALIGPSGAERARCCAASTG